jgi:UDP-N-acetylmuramoyl-L-alanyl-D-glutamate--2,6-diaminopimelate ligase
MDESGTLSIAPEPVAGGPEVEGLTADSREVRPGWLFAALPGTKADGRAFIPDAVAKGAVAVLTDGTADLEALVRREPPVFVVADANPRRRLSLMAARFHSPQPATVAAVTGTNGKTSTASFARQMWQRLGHDAASLGTLGVVGPDFYKPGSLTTPDPVTLHRELAALAARGIDHVCLEASSHGLDQFRLDGLEVTLAAFTNLTRDHLDYHGSMDRYFRAKARLFDSVMRPGGTAVLNADVPEVEELLVLCRKRGHRVIMFGEKPGAKLRLVERRPTTDGQEIAIETTGGRREVHLPLAGTFQAMNVLTALGLVMGSGEELEAALATLAALEGVPGRLQRVAPQVYVDYAHTPDALETVLQALRPHAERRLVCVFGAGGDRDPGKRPLMGEAVMRHADAAIVTDDNPRSEDPAKIRAAILAAASGAREIGDRAEAIGAAVRELRPGDVLVIAGKGHETGQIAKGVVHPFDDAAVARAAWEAR